MNKNSTKLQKNTSKKQTKKIRHRRKKSSVHPSLRRILKEIRAEVIEDDVLGFVVLVYYDNGYVERRVVSKSDALLGMLERRYINFEDSPPYVM